jgi:hypothetical protein
MTIYDKLFITGTLWAFIVCQCIYQAARFRKHKTINHAWHSILYGAFAALFLFGYLSDWWRLGLLILATRIAVFDPTLNLIRRKPFFYNDTAGSTESWTDRIENRLARWVVITLKVIYLIDFVALIIWL